VLKRFLTPCLALCLLVLFGCQPLSTVSLKERVESAQSIAKDASLEPLIIQAQPFQLQSYFRIKDRSKPLRVYIEGDGLAWVTRNRLSEDPTPIQPVSLQLAALDQSDNILYLARPCQFVTNNHCSSEYWSEKRFAKEVIDSTQQAITIVKRHFKLPSIELIGFSGGAAVSVLVATQREDVDRITTLAGNLDHERVNRIHKVTPMQGSLNPIDVADQLKQIPQLHLVGKQDKVIPESIAYAFLEASQQHNMIEIKHVDATHTQGWAEIWQSTLKNNL
jgi:predicted esterase